MEDLWKFKEMRYRLSDLADRAEYNRFVERFHKEEESANREKLFYGQMQIKKDAKDTKND